jgi:sugar transferase (PEP-CTERM/EpsH1 system associated)
MKILWLKADLLLPLDKGGKLRTWHLLRHLARRHAITYLAFGEERGQSAAAGDGMDEVARRVITIPRADPPKGSARFLIDAALHIVDPLPYAIGKYRSRAFRRAVETLLREQAFDLIVCDFLTPSVNLPRRLPCPAVIFTHNVESEIWRRHAETTQGFLRPLYGAQYRRMLRYEAGALERFDAVLTVSDADRATFARIYPGAHRTPVEVVPTGVDTSYFAPRDQSEPVPALPPRLVFTGSMDWLPNEDAMVHFCADVLPSIRRVRPDLELAIVGRAPTAGVRRLATDPRVLVTGRVDDVRPFVRDASLYIVPLRIGGGTRLKIFEAMAMGLPVVSTTVGAEGLPVTPGTHLVVADGADAFAHAVLTLLDDDERRRQLGAAARALVASQYDWSTIARGFEDALIQFAGRTPLPSDGSDTLLTYS